jgi:2-hydroxymuconate-semialdehyde hydrolase
MSNVTNSDKMIDVEGLPVHYLESGEGNGRALLLLHGGIGDTRANWSQVLPPLAEKFHVFAPDLPGFGETAVLPDLSIEKLVHWLRALLEALEQTEAVVVGASVGGLLARLFAAAEPQYVPAIILINGGTMPQFPGFLPSLVRSPLIGDLALRLFGPTPYSSQALDRLIFVKEALTDELRESGRAAAPAFAGLMRSLVLYSYPDKQPPPVPTLLLWGANDPAMPLALAERLQVEIPGAVLSPVAECGHMPQIEASEAFVFQVTAFLEGLSRARQTNLPGVGMLRSN